MTDHLEDDWAAFCSDILSSFTSTPNPPHGFATREKIAFETLETPRELARRLRVALQDIELYGMGTRLDGETDEVFVARIQETHARPLAPEQDEPEDVELFSLGALADLGDRAEKNGETPISNEGDRSSLLDLLEELRRCEDGQPDP